MPSTRRFATALGTVAGVLALAPAAHAGTIRYTVPEAPAYTIQDNGNGIVKVTYKGCVSADQRQELAFNLITEVKNKDANATFKVLKAEGADPVTVFTPASVFLAKNAQQSFDVNLAFTVDNANNGVTTFRIKLEPESGEGLGQGAGIMVRIPCVLAAAPGSTPPAPPAQPPSMAPADGTSPTPPPAVSQPGGRVTQPARDANGGYLPTAGFLPKVASVLAQRPASCIATPRRLRVRQNETTTVVVRVAKRSDVIEGALVRVTFPGGSKTARTDSEGRARVRVRPRRAGRLVIQSEVCFGADRVRVLAARVTQSERQAARFTG